MRQTISKQWSIKSIFFFLAFLCATISSNAQILEPVKWSIESKKLNNKEFELIYTAKIDKGWHLYSQYIKPNGPIATAFNLEESTKYTPIGKVTEGKGLVVYDKTFKMDVTYFNDKAVFVQKIKKVNAEKVKIIGEIEFMSCNDATCIPGYFDIAIEL